jgi:hypothetical protein
MSSRCKKKIGGTAPEPLRRGLHPPAPPSYPPAHPAQTLRYYYSCKEYNAYPTFSHLLFSLHTGGYIVNNPGQQCPWILYTKRTSQCSQILLMNLQHSSKCPPSLVILSFLQSCLSQRDIEHQCALSLNDKQGSLPRKLHSDCHTISLQLLVPTQYLNTIFVTILLPYLHEWLPCIQIL